MGGINEMVAYAKAKGLKAKAVAKEAVDVIGKTGKTILKGGSPVDPPKKKFYTDAEEEMKGKNGKQNELKNVMGSL